MTNTDIILTAGHERIKFRGACFLFSFCDLYLKFIFKIFIEYDKNK